MKKLLIAVLFLFPMASFAQLVGVSGLSVPFGLYLCSEEDPTDCALLTADGGVIKRQAPVGRRAIDYDMQNWQWAKDNIMALPDGPEKTSWEQDAYYWQVRLLADKAWTRLAAGPLPPLFAILAAPESRDPIIAQYRENYTKAAELVLVMEAFFGLPNNEPVGKP